MWHFYWEVWLGGAETTGGLDLRSKSRTLDKPVKSVGDLPIWNYDGSSTNQERCQNVTLRVYSF